MFVQMSERTIEVSVSTGSISPVVGRLGARKKDLSRLDSKLHLQFEPSGAAISVTY